ncbi:MAG: hypothetical protein ACRD1Z_01000, partial [Vicinamibacteria bacterium]
MKPNGYALVFASMLGAAGCQPESPPEPVGGAVSEEDFVAPIERAHSAEIWRQKPAFQAGIVVNFGGNTILDGRMLTTPSMAR